MIRVENRHTYKGDGIYIGRGTIWGNDASHVPYPGVKVLVKDREAALKWYLEHLRAEWKAGGEIKQRLIELAERHKRGEEIVLICSCKPKPCHGDILADAIIKLAAR